MDANLPNEVPEKRRIISFPVLPGSDENFLIDEDDYNAIHEILLASGIKYKLTRLQDMVRKQNENHRVCKLIMPAYDDIVQPLPESIGQMKYLTHLVLGNRCLAMGPLPDSIGGLENLQHLCLRGSGISSLPLSFVRLKNLESLDISFTKNLLLLPREIGELVSLKKLKLRGSMILSLPPSIKKCRLLENVEIAETINIMRLLRMILGKKKFNNQTKQVMRCESISMQCQGGHKRKWTVYKWELSVASLPLREMDKLICQCDSGNVSIRDVDDLQSLGLCLDPLSVHFERALERPPSYCWYEWCNYRQDRGSRFRVKLPAVEEGRWDLKKSTIRRIPSSIRYMSNILDLDLSFTRNLFELPTAIGNLRNLKILNLRGSGIHSLPSSIGNLINLRHLDISRTWIRSWPDSTAQLNNLVHLNLYDCRIVERLHLDFMEVLIRRHHFLENLVLVKDAGSMRYSHLIEDQYYLTTAEQLGYSGGKLWIAREIVEIEEYKRLKIAMVNRSIKRAGMQLSSSKLWPHKVKKLAHGFDCHPSLWGVLDTPPGTNRELRLGGLREADIIYRFLRETNQLWQRSGRSASSAYHERNILGSSD